MTDVAGAGRFEWWRDRRTASFRPLAPALVVVGLTACLVLLAWGAAAWNDVSVTIVWALLGAVGAWAALRRFLAPRPSRAGLEFVQNEAPVVIGRAKAAAGSEARRHRRFVPARRATMLHLQDGRQIAARIIDISIAGVSVAARMTDMDFLAVARVGSQAVGPVRRTPNGAVFGFDTLLDPQPFDASFVL